MEGDFDTPGPAHRFQQPLIGRPALLANFKTSGEPLMNAIMETALKSYELGEINYYQFVSSYESAIQIKLEQLENVLKYNQTTSEIKYFSK